MKKLILSFGFIFWTIFVQSQTLSIKLNNPKAFTIVPAIIITVDSITVTEVTDNGQNVTAVINFFLSGVGITTNKTNRIVIWDDASYPANKDWTKTSLKARIKTILTQ